MEFTSVTFLLFIAIVVFAFHLMPTAAYRMTVLTIANIVFISSYVTELLQLVPLTGFLLLGYATVAWVRAYRSTVVLAVGITVVLIAYVLLKRPTFLGTFDALPFPYLVTGLSYILFRVLQLAIDAGGGDLRDRIGPLAFFNYTCNFLCFVSGPIQRYQSVTTPTSSRSDEFDADLIFSAFSRIITGYVKLMVLSGFANYAFLRLSDRILTPAASPMDWPFVIEYGLIATLYTIYLYYNFSGYMDIVIGVGKLLGHDLPENFNRPFLARNFLEFWSRWHMTLSEWFRTYLFNPLMKVVVERAPQPDMTPYLGLTAFFVTFFIMGIWHGTTVVFIVYGLVMGAGASANKLWRLTMTSLLGRQRYRTVEQHRIYLYASRGLTTAFFTIGVTCLWVDMDQLRWLWGRLGFAGLLGAVFGLAMVCGSMMFAQDFVLSRARTRLAGIALLTRRGMMGNLWSASRILLVLMVSSFFHKAPEFVYRAF